MKFLPITAFLTLGLSANTAIGVEISIQGPCDPAPWHQETVEAPLKTNFGKITTDFLEFHAEPYEGSDHYIKSIRNSPVGDAALEIISDVEMKSYGWCFSIDGIVPASYPDEIEVTTGQETLSWFYAYSHYKSGEWISACVPSAPEAPAFLCKRSGNN